MCAGFTCRSSPARSFPECEALTADSFAVACVAEGQVAVFRPALSISFSRPAALASRCWCALSRSIAAHAAPALRPSGRVANAKFVLCCGGIVPAAVGLSRARPGYRPTRPMAKNSALASNSPQGSSSGGMSDGTFQTKQMLLTEAKQRLASTGAETCDDLISERPKRPASIQSAISIGRSC